MHFFLVGRALEQENVDWLKRLLADGHRIGNHTYDHVNVKAAKAEQISFASSAVAIAGKESAVVVRETSRNARRRCSRGWASRRMAFARRAV